MAKRNNAKLQFDGPPLGGFHERMKYLRDVKQLSLRRAAQACGVSAAAWKNWEAGTSQIGFSSFTKVVDALNVNVAWLVRGSAALDRLPAKSA